MLEELPDSLTPSTVEPNRVRAISAVKNFDEIRPMVPYLIPGGENKAREVLFTEHVLKNLQKSKLDDRVREALLHSLKNRVVGAVAQRGIKMSGGNDPQRIKIKESCR